VTRPSRATRPGVARVVRVARQSQQRRAGEWGWSVRVCGRRLWQLLCACWCEAVRGCRVLSVHHGPAAPAPAPSRSTPTTPTITHHHPPSRTHAPTHTPAAPCAPTTSSGCSPH
jgi:hypothetical protein